MSEGERIDVAINIARQYIEAMVRTDKNLSAVRVKDIRRRLLSSGYECYVDLVIIRLAEAGVIKIRPESMDSLVYPVRE
jgi:hypothetical protein